MKTFFDCSFVSQKPPVLSLCRFVFIFFVLLTTIVYLTYAAVVKLQRTELNLGLFAINILLLIMFFSKSIKDRIQQVVLKMLCCNLFFIMGFYSIIDQRIHVLNSFCFIGYLIYWCLALVVGVLLPIKIQLTLFLNNILLCFYLGNLLLIFIRYILFIRDFSLFWSLINLVGIFFVFASKEILNLTCCATRPES
ncbi:MAG: hypothetical protein JJU05_19460 [Verrucomicrobia bacterium]|nr:hypothetical protein [Verrucomicrobiota bacterium]